MLIGALRPFLATPITKLILEGLKVLAVTEVTDAITFSYMIDIWLLDVNPFSMKQINFSNKCQTVPRVKTNVQQIDVQILH
jgi:hypothetical protein